jgi:hypothetical protein
LPSSGIRKRHDPKNQLIAKSRKKALAEFMKLREGTFPKGTDGVMSPRAAAKTHVSCAQGGKREKNQL